VSKLQGRWEIGVAKSTCVVGEACCPAASLPLPLSPGDPGSHSGRRQLTGCHPPAMRFYRPNKDVVGCRRPLPLGGGRLRRATASTEAARILREHPGLSACRLHRRRLLVLVTPAEVTELNFVDAGDGAGATTRSAVDRHPFGQRDRSSCRNLYPLRPSGVRSAKNRSQINLRLGFLRMIAGVTARSGVVATESITADAASLRRIGWCLLFFVPLRPCTITTRHSGHSSSLSGRSSNGLPEISACEQDVSALRSIHSGKGPGARMAALQEL
jgi:hypothetical protein